MDSISEIRAFTLRELALSLFGPELSNAEEELIRQSTSSTEISAPTTADRSLVIRADLIRWIATDSEATKQIDPKGIRTPPATIVGPLIFDNSTVSVSIALFRCDLKDRVQLDSATTRNLTLEECNLGSTFAADNIVIHGSLYIIRCFLAAEVSLSRAQIDAELSFAGSYAANMHDSIVLDGATVRGSVLLNDDFEAAGSIRMHSSKLGELNCSGATLAVNDGALSLDGATVSGDVFLSQGFACMGEVRLPGAHIAGNLECITAKIGSLICHNMIIDGDFMWMDIGNPDRAQLSLVGVKVKSIRDERGSWPVAGNLELDGLIYDQLAIHLREDGQPMPQGETPPRQPFKAMDRVFWIRRQAKDRLRESQPWVQLAKVSLALGDEQGARHVAFCLARHRAATYSYVPRSIKVLVAWIREEPFRIAISIATILVVSTAIFQSASDHGAIAPTDKDAYNAWATGNRFSSAFPHFYAIVYSLENELPLVKLGQDEKWRPDSAHQPEPLSQCQALAWTRVFNSYLYLMIVRWTLILLGWIQATVLAAALANRFKS
jgi:hypothetical protein